MEHIVEIKNLKKHFGELRVLDDINFHIDKGDVITVIGSPVRQRQVHPAPVHQPA